MRDDWPHRQSHNSPPGAQILVAGLVLLSMSVARLGAQQPHDGADHQKATTGKIARQYDTGG